MGTATGQEAQAFCFDVFDSVLTRVVGDPNHVFLLLGRRLSADGAIGCSAEQFARQRMLAEERANLAAGQHATLQRIHRELSQALGLPAIGVDGLVEAEERIERELSRGVAPAGPVLAEARRSGGGTVTFVTDTNMSAAFVRELLERQGLWSPADRLFASCEAGADKARGMMFPLVSGQLGVHPSRILHHGNDATADGRNARLSGWKVRHLPDANPNRYERALAASAYATGGLASLFAGMSRQARLARPAADGREATLRTVAAGVMAPTLAGWMLWTLRRAAQLGLGRLYFISRDGQVLLEVARRLEAVLQTGLELRYLCGGRQAVQLAGEPDTALDSLLRLEFCSVDDLLETFQLSPGQAAELLPPGLRDPAGWTRNLAAAERAEITTLAARSPLRDVLRERAEQVRALLLDYLRQEGWGGGVPFGLVDVGWRGSMARALADALHGSSLAAPARHFYFGLSDDSRRVAGPEVAPQMEAWFFDDAAGTGFLPYPQSSTSLLEMFCAGDHGAVVGYRRSGERIEPVLRSPTSPMAEWGLPLLRETTADFVDLLVRTASDTPELVDLAADPRDAVKRVLDLFWLHPSAAEALHWGSFPVEVTLSNRHVLPLAEPMRLGRIVRTLGAGGLAMRSQHSWPRGTILASPKVLGAFLSVAHRLRSEAPRLRRRVQWLRLQAALLLGRGGQGGPTADPGPPRGSP